MSDKRINFECTYCGATYTLRYVPEGPKPEFCGFCGEFDSTTQHAPHAIAQDDDEELEEDIYEADGDEDD